jgi:hypothetical protein
MPKPVRTSDYREYTFYFTDGIREVIRGLSLIHAFEKTHGHSDMSDVAIALKGRDESYKWNTETRTWDLR